MRAVIDLLLLNRLARGSLGRSLIGLAAVFAVLLGSWAIVGQPALQVGLRALLYAGVAGVALLPVVGLALAFVYLAAWVSSLGGDRPRAGAPRRVR